MSAINDLLKWYQKEGIYETYDALAGKLLPHDPETFDPLPEAELARVVFEKTALPPTEFLRLSKPERLPWLNKALQGPDTPPAATDSKNTNTAHSDDFRSLKWFGEVYEFTANQALVVKMLFEHWENGTPDVGSETLLSEVDREFPPEKLSVLFRGHPAWNTIIVSGGTKGTRKLHPPQKK